jgi:hypothetical protein
MAESSLIYWILPSLTNVRLGKIPLKSVKSRGVAKILPLDD